MLKVEPGHSAEKIDKFRDFRLAAYDLPQIHYLKGGVGWLLVSVAA